MKDCPTDVASAEGARRDEQSAPGAALRLPLTAYVGVVALLATKGAGRAELLLPVDPVSVAMGDLLGEGEREGYVGFPI